MGRRERANARGSSVLAGALGRLLCGYLRGRHDPHHPHSFPTRRLFRSAASVGKAERAIEATATAALKDLITGLLDAGVAICAVGIRSEEHTSELQSLRHLVCRLLLEKKRRWPTVWLRPVGRVSSAWAAASGRMLVALPSSLAR